MGRRVYVSPMDSATVGTAVQDIFALKTAASNGAQVHHIQLSAGGVTTAAEVRMRLKRATATFTLGSVGSAVTPVAVDAGDSLAATATTRINDTTQSTTSGAFTTLENFQWNVLLPFDYMPGPEDEDRDACVFSQGLVLDLPATIGAAYTTSGFLKFREYP